MSSGASVFDRLFKVLAAITKMVMDNVRDPEQVHRYLQRIVEKPDFVSVLDAPPRTASVSTEPTDGWAAEWERFYKEVFGLEANFEGVSVPEEKPDFGWAVFVAQGITLNAVWAKCGELFPTCSFIGDDFDRGVPTNDRTSESAYCRRFRSRVEADVELKDASANDLTKREIQGITLLERFLLELWYFWRTGGGHLDLLKVTICAGSRNMDGNVPNVNWDDNQFKVNNYTPDNANDNLRFCHSGDSACHPELVSEPALN